MPYYPLSQVKTNLYTSGGEFVRKIDNINYIGFYYQTSAGKYFSGKDPNQPNSTEIIRSETDRIINENFDPNLSFVENSRGNVESQVSNAFLVPGTINCSCVLLPL